jgi:hypothetical protein
MAAILEAGDQLQFSVDVVTRDIDEGALVVNLETGKTWKLNQVGAAVCRGIDQGQDLSTITKDVAARHGIDAAIVRRDIDALVADLRKEGLVEPRVGG